MVAVALAMAAAALSPAPAVAQASSVVICDSKVKRMVDTLRKRAGTMTAAESERAHEALYAAITRCRPLATSHRAAGSRPEPEAAPDSRLGQGLDLERQSLRAQQNVLSAPELREGERRLDAIERKAQTDPRAARDMLRLYEADRSLSTINRPIPGGPDTPSMVGPGDRY